MTYRVAKSYFATYKDIIMIGDVRLNNYQQFTRPQATQAAPSRGSNTTTEVQEVSAIARISPTQRDLEQAHTPLAENRREITHSPSTTRGQLVDIFV